MTRAIKVTSPFATPYDTARVLGVSKKRTEELIRMAQRSIDRILQRDAIKTKATAKRKAVVSSAKKKRGRKAVTKA
jgi:hypothetical protein